MKTYTEVELKKMDLATLRSVAVAEYEGKACVVPTEYGVRWTEAVGRDMRVTTKEKFFKLSAARDKFVLKLEAKDNFIEVLSWHN